MLVLTMYGILIAEHIRCSCFSNRLRRLASAYFFTGKDLKYEHREERKSKDEEIFN